MTDQELLREYAERDSQAAFRELVGRHLGLVYSTARRQVRDAQLAEDISQQVFSLLAQKAGRLKTGVIVAGWLYRASRQVSSEFVRRECRRYRREQAAMETMNIASERDWHELEPWLEEAMASLGQTNHDAVVLRYFENRSLKEVGIALGLTEDAAQKRLARAIEKLRMFLQRRGKTISATTLTAALVTGAIQPVPGALAATVASAALSTAAASGAGSGFIQTLIFMKKKTLLMSATVLTAVLVPLTLQQMTVNRLKQENQSLRSQATQSGDAQRETAPAEKMTAQQEATPQAPRNDREVLRLRGEVGVLRSELSAAENQKQAAMTEAQARQLTYDTVEVMKSFSIAMQTYAIENQNQLPTNFAQMKDLLPEVLPGKLSLENFEFLPRAHSAGQLEPNSLFIRERNPRRLPNGKWARTYMFADGSIKEKLSDDGNFEEFESEHAGGAAPGPSGTTTTEAGSLKSQTDELILLRYGVNQQ